MSPVSWEDAMEALLHMGGYLVSVLAAAGIVAGIEALNERCPHGPGRAQLPAVAPVAEPRRLRQSRS
jgi:hypothetical protein